MLIVKKTARKITKKADRRNKKKDKKSTISQTNKSFRKYDIKRK